MDRYTEIRSFLLVTEKGSFAAAALTEGVTPVVMGRRLDTLEKRLGVRLMLASIGVPLTVKGREHLPDGACVIVANHASYVDGLVLTAALPRRFNFVVQDGAASWPLVGLTLRRMGVIFVNRDSAHSSAQLTRQLMRRLHHGESLAIFAEGTFKHEPGLLPFKTGAFLMASNQVVMEAENANTRTSGGGKSWTNMTLTGASGAAYAKLQQGIQVAIDKDNKVTVSGVDKGQVGQVNYSAAKAGMIGFTKALAQEGASKGVTVNAIAPGVIQTTMIGDIKPDVMEGYLKQIPIGRLGKPEDVANALLWLCSPARKSSRRACSSCRSRSSPASATAPGVTLIWRPRA